MSTPVQSSTAVRDVWANNVEEEFAALRANINDYPYVAMDTEFPGVVATPLGQFKSKEDFNYQQVTCNVNMLKLIQVGFALLNDKGESPPGGGVWQFNFQFSVSEDMSSEDSLNMLRAAGIDFNRLQTDGIPMDVFGELLTTSGLIVDDRITWLTFSAGYDFGYLVRSITLRELPKDETTFFEMYRAVFPKCYDVKLLLRMPPCKNAKLKGGLQEVADQLDVKRVGARHQAGSDALLTAHTFFKIKQHFFADSWERVANVVQGHLFGLGISLSLTEASLSHEDQLVEKEMVNSMAS